MAPGEDLGFDALPPRQRRRVVATATLRAIGTTTVVVAIYYLVPMDHSVGIGTVVEIGLGVVALVAIIGWQLWQITRSPYPTARAAEGLALILPLYVLLFATLYHSISRANGASFGGPVTRTDAMYFSTTVFTTVGFGDITAKSEGARIAVTIQMMLDLVIIGLVVRLVLNAIKIGQRRHNPPDGQSRTGAEPAP